MQGTSFAFQAYQVLRYGSLIGSAVAMAWFYVAQNIIDDYETLLLIGGSATFFWLGGLLDGFLLLQKKSDPLLGAAIMRRTRRLAAGLSAASAVACLVVGLAFYPQLDQRAVWAFAGYIGLETLSQLVPYIYIVQGKARKLLAFGGFAAIGYCAAIGIPAALGWGLPSMVFALLALAVGKTIWLLSDQPRTGDNHRDVADVARDLWRISWPLILATLLSQSAVYVDGFLVQRFFPDDFVDFRYGAKEFPLILLLANSVSIVRAGEIAGGLRTGEVDGALRDLRNSSKRLIVTLFPISLLLMAISGPLFELVFANRFPHAVPVFDLFLLLAIPRLMFPQSVIRGFQKTTMMSVSAGAELVLNVVLTLVLMQFYGIAGIAAGTVLAFFAEKSILLAYAEFKLKIAWRSYAPVGLWMACSLLLVMAWVVKYVLLPSL